MLTVLNNFESSNAGIVKPLISKVVEHSRSMGSNSLYHVLPVELVCGICHETQVTRFASRPNYCLIGSYKAYADFHIHTLNTCYIKELLYRLKHIVVFSQFLCKELYVCLCKVYLKCNSFIICRPCILIFDSLAMPTRYGVVRTLRE